LQVAVTTEKNDTTMQFLHYEVLEMARVTATVERQLPNGQMKIDLFYLALRLLDVAPK
jgi:hypothetical protein